MPRRPSVRYFPSRKAYYCQIRGKQHKLAEGPDDFLSVRLPDGTRGHGPTYKAAVKKYQELTALDAADQAKDNNTVRVVLEKYLQFIDGSKRKKSTLRIRKRYYEAFCDGGYGEVTVGGLTHLQVYAFCEKMKQPRQAGNRLVKWGPGNIKNMIDSLQVAFNWAVKSGLITRNPLVGIEKPSPRSRGRDCIIGPAKHQEILGAVSPAFRRFVVVLENTGARPGEIANATAADFDPKLGAIVYHSEANRQEGEFSHKTGQKGKDRRIFLTGEALEIIQKLVKRHPTGPLFGTTFSRKGGPARRPWTPFEVAKRFRAIKQKVGLPNLHPYAYRHTFATRWLEAGKSIEVLAELMGNTPEVIRRHYSHLCGNPKNLRAQLEEFKRTASGAETQTPRLRVVGGD